jgi:hypothetical protein
MITSFATHAVHRWSVESQQRARRNAMLAATECARRRAEREDVEEFFSALYAASAATTDATTEARAAHG